MTYYAFDLLYVDRYDLRGSPLLARKKALQRILEDAGGRFRPGCVPTLPRAHDREWPYPPRLRFARDLLGQVFITASRKRLALQLFFLFEMSASRFGLVGAAPE